MFYTVNNFRIELEKNGLLVGEQFIRSAIQRKEIKTKRLGRRIFIPEEELLKIIGKNANKAVHFEIIPSKTETEESVLTKDGLIQKLQHNGYRLLAYNLGNCLFLEIDNKKMEMKIAVPQNTNASSIKKGLEDFFGRLNPWKIETFYKSKRMLDEAVHMISNLSDKGVEECQLYMKRWEL